MAILLTPTEEQIQKACEFWADKLGKFNAFFQTSKERRDPANRDVSFGEIQATVEGQRYAAGAITPGVRERLIQEIRKYLTERRFPIVVDHGSERPLSIFLSVNY